MQIDLNKFFNEYMNDIDKIDENLQIHYNDLINLREEINSKLYYKIKIIILI